MSEISIVDEPLLVHLARRIGEEFSELGGRSVAVSEVEPFGNKTDRPTLPLAVVALIGEQNTSAGKGGATAITIVSDVLVQFIFEPVKYKDGLMRDTPFFAFYDYESLRNRLLAFLRSYRSPNNHAAAYRTLDIESDEFAVYVAFRLNFQGDICTGDDVSMPVSIFAGVKAPVGVCTDKDEHTTAQVCEPPAAHKPLPD